MIYEVWVSLSVLQYKVEVASLNRKAGSYYSELEANTSKLNTSLAEIDKLNGEIKHLQNLNSTMDDEGNGDFGVSYKRGRFVSSWNFLHQGI